MYLPQIYEHLNQYIHCWYHGFSQNRNKLLAHLFICILINNSKKYYNLPIQCLIFASSVALLYVYFSYNFFAILFFIATSTTLQIIFKKSNYLIVPILINMIILQSYMKYDDWESIKGCLMIFLMKFLSSSMTSIPLLLLYYLDPGSIVFGPWYKPTDKKTEFQQISLKIIPCLLSSIIAFGFSTCFELIVLYTQYNSLTHHKWIIAYIQALSFRTGHYFISYFSEATFLLTHPKEYQDFQITRMMDIELPYSLTTVVIAWNRPMSQFLKQYIFKPLQTSTNTFFALVLTYIFSSLLHGLELRIMAILLSLAFYTYVEYVIRKSLSETLNACVGPKKCLPHCNHIYKSNLWVRIINWLFTFQAMFHLAYLGCPFGMPGLNNFSEELYPDYIDEDTTNNLNGWMRYIQHWKITHLRWSYLNYASHLYVLTSYVIYICVTRLSNFFVERTKAKHGIHDKND